MSKEIQLILNELDSFKPNEKAILATVVDVQGSGYRLPGAKMLIDENGRASGMVSGGCLEADVMERARRLLETGRAELLTYDTTTAASGDSIFSLNMGCNGVVRILIEPVEKGGMLTTAWRNAVESRWPQTIATLISNDRSLPVGGRIFYGGVEPFDLENLPDFLENSREIRARCAAFFDRREKAGTVEFDLTEGRFEFFFENIDPPLNLLIFGAGYDAIPLAGFAKDLGWRVTLIDHRPAFAARERFPSVDQIIVEHPENLAGEITPDENSAAVVMTHNYEKDREIMKFLLPLGLDYIGALGPKRRTEKLLEELKAEGFGFEEKELKNLHAPVGLDIGADTPESIALSIASEIKSVLTGRDGGHLRERQGSIYGRRVISD
ncbi:MAG: XdhC/CoxI family protein [Pyrinomonadaceae bacterium]